MSGKSTLLRTLGVNVVLAQAGAPVRARRLRISPLAVGASIRSPIRCRTACRASTPKFSACARSSMPPAAPLPVLFLIDEFLHGTNSHDRRIGAEALVRGLVKRGAIGLITTHDLALADIADDLGEQAPPTSISRTASKTARCASITSCSRGWSARATPSS